MVEGTLITGTRRDPGRGVVGLAVLSQKDSTLGKTMAF